MKTPHRRNLFFLAAFFFIFLPAFYELVSADWAAPQPFLETETPTATTATSTPEILPTETETPLPADTETPVPSNTPIPSDTPIPASPTPTHTHTPEPTNTSPPPPTNTSLPPNTPTPQPTNTQIPTGGSLEHTNLISHPSADQYPGPPDPDPAPANGGPPTMPGPTHTPTHTPSPSPTIMPFAAVHLPVFYYNTSLGEPNDSCPDAFFILPMVVYHFLPDDASDWYQFELETAGNLSVTISNFVPLAGQVAVYRGSHCGNVVFLGSNGDSNITKSVNLGVQPAGKYFIFVSNDGPLNNVTPYSLQVKFISLN